MVKPVLRLANCADTKPTEKGNTELPRLPLANSQLDLRAACPPKTCEKMAIVVGKTEERPKPASKTPGKTKTFVTETRIKRVPQAHSDTPIKTNRVSVTRLRRVGAAALPTSI